MRVTERQEGAAVEAVGKVVGGPQEGGGAQGEQTGGGEGEAGGESKEGEVCARKGAVRRSVRCSGAEPKMLDAESMR